MTTDSIRSSHCASFKLRYMLLLIKLIILQSLVTTVDNSSVKTWAQTKRIVHKVHSHMCVHTPYYDMRTLLRLKNLWSDDVQVYLGDIIWRCSSCGTSSTPPTSRKFKFGSVNRCLNEVLMIDYFYIFKFRLFHCMDSYTGFSSLYVVPESNLFSAPVEFETTWVAQFWSTVADNGDQEFWNQAFRYYLTSHGTSFGPVHNRKNHKRLWSRNKESLYLYF